MDETQEANNLSQQEGQVVTRQRGRCALYPSPARTQSPVVRRSGRACRHRLLDKYLLVSIFRACAKSQASEHASRLAAMQAAERNLDERYDEVTMIFRRARQSVITSELLDVVAGFEAITAKEK